MCRQYHFDPDPELLSLFKNFDVKETDEVTVMMMDSLSNLSSPVQQWTPSL